MSKRVSQLDIFQSGFRDDNDAPVAGGSAEFYTADQAYTTPKNAYTTKAKDATLTSVTLDANGAYPNGLFFDGATVYDIRVKDSAGATVRDYANVKTPQSTYNASTKTGAYTAVFDDDALTCDGTFTVSLYPVASFLLPLTVKNIGLGTITVAADGSELIDGGASITLSAGVTRELFVSGGQWYAKATTSGTDFTDTTLIAGTNISFDSSGGTTTVNVPDASETVKGAIEIATQAEADAGTAAALALTPATIASLALGQSLADPGYVTLPGGFILQWGTRSMTDNDEDTFDLPLAYPTAHLAAWASPTDLIAQGISNWTTAAASPVSLTQILVQYNCSATDTQNIQWFSIGY